MFEQPPHPTSRTRRPSRGRLRRSARRAAFRQLSVEALEARELLACDMATDHYCNGHWRVNVTNGGAANSATTSVQLPGGAFSGNAVEISYEHSPTHIPIHSVLLTDGFYRPTSPSGELTTSFRSFAFYSSGNMPIPTGTAVNVQVLGVTSNGELQINATLLSQDPLVGDRFESSLQYLLSPPADGFNVTRVTQSVRNVSGHDVTPAWNGHLALDEQWRLFGVSSMHVANDYTQTGLPAWYDSLDPAHAYVGNILNDDPSDDAYSVNGDIRVYPA